MRYLVASNTGRGFLVPGSGAWRREAHRQANPEPEAGRRGGVLCIPADGDHVAIIGENRRLLVFPLEQVPEMARGAGVILQRYKDGGLSDAKVFRLADGLTWRLGDRVRTETNVQPWVAERATSGRLLPNGFPRSLKFGG